MRTPPIQTVRHQRLSLWQSAIGEHVSNTLNVTGNPTERRAHPMTLGGNLHIENAQTKRVMSKAPEAMSETEQNAAVSEYLFNEVNKRLEVGEGIDDLSSDPVVRKYSTADTKGWLQCAVVYASYEPFRSTFYYNAPPSASSDFGVIEWKIPNGAKIGIIGDWGTMMPDAKGLFEAMLSQGVDLVIHLGDIYYSGTNTESRSFIQCIKDAMTETGVSVPFFSIPGNHEYYAWGDGFFNHVLPNLNTWLNPSTYGSTCQQEASFFCLKSEDGRWQFLGMDTGHNSVSAAQIAKAAIGSENAPTLRDDEIAWHQDKMDKFSGNTILLSHHQLFTANVDIDHADGYPDMPGTNLSLLDVFQKYFDKVGAWFWGHEHNMMIFKKGILNMNMGRLLGSSAYEETVGEDPYKPVNPLFAQRFPFQNVKLSSDTEGYYYHSYAIMTMNQNGTDDIGVEYFEFPSWGDQAPSAPNPSSLLQETIPASFLHPYHGIYLPAYLAGTLTNGTNMNIYAYWSLRWHALNGSAAVSITASKISYSTRYRYDSTYYGTILFEFEILDPTHCKMSFALNGKLWNNGQDNFVKNGADGTYTADLKTGTITYTSNDGQLKVVQKSAEPSKVSTWNNYIQFDVTTNGITESYTLNAENSGDEELAAVAEPTPKKSNGFFGRLWEAIGRIISAIFGSKK